MTDKEQLKKIKEKYLENEKFWYDTYKEQVKLSQGQIKKLQERVQELEEKHKKYVALLNPTTTTWMLKFEKLYKRNKRYREAIEKIQDIQQWYRKEPDYEVLNIVNEALEGEE